MVCRSSFRKGLVVMPDSDDTYDSDKANDVDRRSDMTATTCSGRMILKARARPDVGMSEARKKATRLVEVGVDDMLLEGGSRAIQSNGLKQYCVRQQSCGYMC